jgi:hypothetical protein
MSIEISNEYDLLVALEGCYMFVYKSQFVPRTNFNIILISVPGSQFCAHLLIHVRRCSRSYYRNCTRFTVVNTNLFVTSHQLTYRNSSRSVVLCYVLHSVWDFRLSHFWYYACFFLYIKFTTADCFPANSSYNGFLALPNISQFCIKAISKNYYSHRFANRRSVIAKVRVSSMWIQYNASVKVIHVISIIAQCSFSDDSRIHVLDEL